MGQTMCQEKLPPHHYTSNSSPDCKHKAGWVHGFILFILNSEITICMPQHKSTFIRLGCVFPVLGRLCHCGLRFRFLADMGGTRCGHFVLCGWLWGVVIWVTVIFLSVATSLTFLLWPLSSAEQFHQRHFFLSRDGCVCKFQKIRSFRNTQIILPRSKSLRLRLFHILFDFNINWSSWLVFAWFYAWHCCHIIGWLDNYMD